jgi:hypothetical protein
LPGVAIAGEARLAIAVPSGPVVFASGDVWRTATSTAGTAGTAGGVRLDLWTVGLGICPLERRSSARAVGLCLGGEAGRLHASGFGFDMPFDKDRWAADLALGGELRQRIGGALFVALGLRAVVPLIRDQIVYSVSGQPPHSLFRMSPLAAVAGLRIGYGLR